MGRFTVTIELANNDDLVRASAGDLPTQNVRRLSLKGWVDTGATRLVLPESAVGQLGLRLTGQVAVRYADGRREMRQLASGIWLAYAGRNSVFNAVVEPNRDTALIGAIVLEDLDLVTDCTSQALVPRDPLQIISEIE